MMPTLMGLLFVLPKLLLAFSPGSNVQHAFSYDLSKPLPECTKTMDLLAVDNRSVPFVFLAGGAKLPDARFSLPIKVSTAPLISAGAVRPLLLKSFES